MKLDTVIINTSLKKNTNFRGGTKILDNIKNDL